MSTSHDTMDELKRLLLAHYTPEQAIEWLFSPHPQMADTVPLKRIECGADQTYELVKILRRLDDGSGDQM